jgi:hypothetical protein
MRLSLHLILGSLLLSTAARAAPRKPKAAPPASEVKTEPPAAPATPPKSSNPTLAEGKRETKVVVKVMEVAGGQAFLQPGSAAGVRRGTKVRFKDREFFVVESTAKYAVVSGLDLPEELSEGLADPDAAPEAGPRLLPKPVSPASFRGVWEEATAPALTQHPKPVPLGNLDLRRKNDLYLYGLFGANAPTAGKAGAFFRAEFGVRAHWEPSAIFQLNGDLSVQKWLGADIDGRSGDSARTIVRVRDLNLGVGRPTQFFGSLGRLKFAAATLGTLDGLRLRAPIGESASISGFGGLVPNPLSGSPDAGAQRFGVEFDYTDYNSALRPSANLVAHGSLFDGKPDERRLAAQLGIFPGQSRLGVRAEVSAFDKDNPWGLKPVELTALGADASVRVSNFQLGVRADLQQQERSRWMASFFPQSWLCVTSGQGPAEVCADARSNTRHQVAADVSLTTTRLALFLSGSVMLSPTREAAAKQVGAFASARVLRLFRIMRLEASGSFTKGSFSNLLSGSVGPGVTFGQERFDLSAYYRMSSVTYVSDGRPLLGHSLGAAASFLPTDVWTLTLQGEQFIAQDTQGLSVFVMTALRPRL